MTVKKDLEGLMCSSCGAGGIRKESRSPVAVCLLFTGTIGEIVRRGGISLTSLNCSVSKGWSPRGVDCEFRLGGRREVEGGPPTPKPSSLPSLRSMPLASLFLVICISGYNVAQFVLFGFIKDGNSSPLSRFLLRRPFPKRLCRRQRRGIRNT